MTTALWNPLDPAFKADPYPTYQALLQGDPLQRGPLGFLILTRYRDCLALLRHPSASKDWRKSPAFVLPEGVDPDRAAPSFLELDPPDHTRLRSLVSRAFTPRRVETLRPRMEQIVEEACARFAADESVEVISALALPLPLQIICELLGVPADDVEEFRPWSAVLARAVDPLFTLPQAMIDQVAWAQDQAFTYFRALIAERRRSPRDDLLSDLIAAFEDRSQLTENELLRTLVLLLAAGHETTVNLIANGLLAFARHEAEFARLRSDPSLAASAVEEVVRFDPPVQLDARLLLDDVELPSGRVGRFELPLLLLGAANRDPEVFVDPDRFDIGRSNNRHLGFGFGIHHCLGAPLARAEGEIVFTTIARRFRSLAVRNDPPPYKENITLRGIEALEMSFDRDAGPSSTALR